MAAAPTINNPAGGSTFATGSTVNVSWTHNGNLTQSGAQVELTKPDATTTTATITGAANYNTYSTTGYASGEYKVRVRTKQGTATYGDWSPYRSFYLYAEPSVSITLPTATDGGTVTNLPLQVGFTYSDTDGSFSRAGFWIEEAGGVRIYELPASSETDGWTESGGVYSLSIPVSDFLPDNNKTYYVVLGALSTTGLGANGGREFKTQWATPSDPNIAVTAGSNATVSITYGWVSSGSPAVTATALYRVDADGETMLEQHTGTSGTVSYTYTDYLPLLDSETTYKVCAFANSGAYSQKTANVTVLSDGLCYFNWGADGSDFAAFDMDLAWTKAIEPKRALYEVIGLRDPVLRTTNRRTKTLTASGVVWWDDDAPLERLQDVPERVWFREPRGHRIPVALTVSLTYPKGVPTTAVQISMTQVSEV